MLGQGECTQHQSRVDWGSQCVSETGGVMHILISAHEAVQTMVYIRLTALRLLLGTVVRFHVFMCT